ncbi:MAG: class I SAM-dependent DNA methyltransferase [Clostridiales bacterium]|nr:class I SAM-dependent DNA methyltransferase [Clostridiales bacterium]
MSDIELRKNIKEFVDFWTGKGYEKGQSQTFWLSFLSKVLGVKEPEKFIEFEDQVHIDKSTGFIDGYIPETKVLIEQKAIDKDLRKAVRQSDGSLLTPFQQAKKYIAELPVDKHPKYVITCNFKSFLIYDMNNPNSEPDEIFLENLEKDYYRFNFITDTGSKYLKKELEISFKAGEIVGYIYDELLKMYHNPENKESLKSLNILCVRLVFCLYAEDAGLFGKHLMFHDYLSRFEARDLRRALIDLFKVLDTKPEDRDPYLDDSLKVFPYVNGGLFSQEDIEIPNFTDKIKELLLEKASEDFDWSEISPTIFGAVFESTLNPETRRSGGMHYTSIENIHKVIDPLFLNDLKTELEEIENIKTIKSTKTSKGRNERLKEFQEKLAGLSFLDPACGSGNFLTETYLSLRRLENQVIFDLTGGQIIIGGVDNDLIKVDIHQFYGIEINDFAVTVAKTALWIAESQMLKKTEEIVHQELKYLPLKSYSNIIEENALRIDWNDVVDKKELNYIMGNPPFIGKGGMRTDNVENDFSLLNIDETLDYVAGWYFKAAEFIQNTEIRCAFVSTNSITQGEQVSPLWKRLLNDYNIIINFAYRTFIWDSEASLKAHVHCVIVGFSLLENDNKKIYLDDTHLVKANNINGYLIDARNIFIEKRTKPISDVSLVTSGNRPDDNGNYIFSEEEMQDFINKYPEMKPYIRKFLGAREFINNIPRYCLWLYNVEPSKYRNNKEVMRRIENVSEFRSKAKGESLKKLANEPLRWKAIQPNDSDYILLPRVSSQNRRYIPIGFVDKNVIGNDAIQMLPNATLYDFGILTSNVHMAWARVVAGRLKSDLRYSNTLVYNNFPWPKPDDKQKERIEKTAQAILDARTLYPKSSLADLYDELTMPVELRKAHQENDKAVMDAYGFDWKHMTESDCVAKLMEMYKKIVDSK